MVATTKGDLQDHRREDVSLIPKRSEPPLEAERSPPIRSAPPSEPPPLLSPPTTHHESVLVHSPLKRRKTADSAAPQYPSSTDPWPHAPYNPIRFKYLVYDTPKVFSSVSPDGFAYMPEQQYVTKVVEAEYRRLADSAAATIPSEELLSPAIWKKEFHWPNEFTTTQCACLMRYFIENLAPWVGDFVSSTLSQEAGKLTGHSLT